MADVFDDVVFLFYLAGREFAIEFIERRFGDEEGGITA